MSIDYDMLFLNSMEGILQVDDQDRILRVNPLACAILGTKEQDLLGCCLRSFLDLNDPRLPLLTAERKSIGHARGELRLRRAQQDPFDADILFSSYQTEDGATVTNVFVRDISGGKVLARRLQDSNELMHNLAQHVPGMIYQLRLYPDGHSRFPFVSDAIRDIFELDPDQVRDDGKDVFSRLHPEDYESVLASIMSSAHNLQPWQEEFRVVLPRQGERWRLGHAIPQPMPDGSVQWHGYLADVTDRKLADQAIHRLAYFDPLTTLPNRRLLMDRLKQQMAQAARVAKFGALLCLDLDNFKQINDARGHAEGDRLLKLVGERLSHQLRTEDTLARIGGDEFVVMTSELGTDTATAARAAMAVAEKLRLALQRPFQIEDREYSTSGSIGIALFPKGENREEDLLREADTALYRAKDEGRNRVAFFEDFMQIEVEKRLELEHDIKEALAHRQFQAHVQSQVGADGSIVGAELLLRWQHPQRGFVSPVDFIPAAERAALIHELGHWVLEQACNALKRMKDAGLGATLSVNVSPIQFRKEDFVERIGDLLRRTQAPASLLILEVTEGLFIEDWEQVRRRMGELSALGIRFSIDDFGTGYSSLGYLKRLPLYELKIDRSFVRDTPDNPNDTAIVQSILSMARHLGLKVVAEGVERQAQADFLIAHECDCLQGYLYARPEPLTQWLQRQLEATPIGHD